MGRTRNTTPFLSSSSAETFAAFETYIEQLCEGSSTDLVLVLGQIISEKEVKGESLNVPRRWLNIFGEIVLIKQAIKTHDFFYSECLLRRLVLCVVCCFECCSFVRAMSRCPKHDLSTLLATFCRWTSLQFILKLKYNILKIHTHIHWAANVFQYE